MKPVRLVDKALELAGRFEQVAEGYVPFTPLNLLYLNLDKGVGSILDLGTGKGHPMKFINRRKRYYTVGVDIFSPYLQECRRKGSHGEYILCDVRGLPFRRKSFDTVLCLRVLEHLTADEGERLLAEMEVIARRQVAIITPAYDFDQSPYDDNPYQEHRFIWSLAQLRARGYKVWPNGLRHVQFDTARMGYLQKLLASFSHLLWVISGPLVLLFPALSGCLVAVKNVDGASRVRP